MKHWLRENPLWGKLVLIGGGCFLLSAALFFWARSNYADAETQFRDAAQRQQQLEASNPYPNEANVKKTKLQLAGYRDSVDKLRTSVGTHVLAAAAVPPNEFQTRLQQTVAALIESARLNRVKLPDNFKLGFDEYVSTLPKTEETAKLSRELAQAQLLADLIIDAKPDAITMFRRVSIAAPSPTPGRAVAPPTAPSSNLAAIVGRTVVEFTVSGSPASLRKIVNQVSAASDQFYILRTLHVKNQKEKGPAREATTAPTPVPAAPAVTPAVPGASPAAPALNFIVGTEHVDLSARVELINFDGLATK